MMWDQLQNLDTRLFLFCNSKHVSWMDAPMYYMSSDWFWIPLYLVFIYLIIKEFRKRSWLVLLLLALAVGSSDQVSNRIKKTVQRLRPSHTPQLEKDIHLVKDYKGGQYGFVSSHAANTFCVATLLSLLFSPTAPYLVLLFFWASLVTYTRLYLGVHYPADLFFGALLGSGSGLLFYYFFQSTEKVLFHTTTLSE